MPMKLNVGLCQKVGESNYGSRGASVNLELELDSALVAEPAKLKEKIRGLFAVVRTSLTEELNGNGHGNGNGHANGQGNGNGHSNGNGDQNPQKPRSATPSQVKAIFAITKAQGRNMGSLLNERFHVAYAEQLTVQQASALIDELKRSRQQDNG
jgi:hypothetical protein